MSDNVSTPDISKGICGHGLKECFSNECTKPKDYYKNIAIDYKARLQKAEEREKIYKEALGWYADKKYYEIEAYRMLDDKGKTAREALSKAKGIKYL